MPDVMGKINCIQYKSDELLLQAEYKTIRVACSQFPYYHLQESLISSQKPVRNNIIKTPKLVVFTNQMFIMANPCRRFAFIFRAKNTKNDGDLT